jgi:hypothetical protein
VAASLFVLFDLAPMLTRSMEAAAGGSLGAPCCQQLLAAVAIGRLGPIARSALLHGRAAILDLVGCFQQQLS